MLPILPYGSSSSSPANLALSPTLAGTGMMAAAPPPFWPGQVCIYLEGMDANEEDDDDPHMGGQPVHLKWTNNPGR